VNLEIVSNYTTQQQHPLFGITLTKSPKTMPNAIFAEKFLQLKAATHLAFGAI